MVEKKTIVFQQNRFDLVIRLKNAFLINYLIYCYIRYSTWSSINKFLRGIGYFCCFWWLWLPLNFFESLTPSFQSVIKANKYVEPNKNKIEFNNKFIVNNKLLQNKYYHVSNWKQLSIERWDAINLVGSYCKFSCTCRT